MLSCRKSFSKVFVLQLYYLAAQQQQTYQVWDNHQAVDGISQIPSKTQSGLRTDEDHTQPNQFYSKAALFTKNVNRTTLSVSVEADQAGKACV